MRKQNRVNIDGCGIFHREAGNAQAPILLLHRPFRAGNTRR
jgi:hypothetical protein